MAVAAAISQRILSRGDEVTGTEGVQDFARFAGPAARGLKLPTSLTFRGIVSGVGDTAKGFDSIPW